MHVLWKNFKSLSTSFPPEQDLFLFLSPLSSSFFVSRIAVRQQFAADFEKYLH